MKQKINNLLNKYESIIIFVMILLISISLFCGTIYKCSHNENYLYYGDDNYRFVTVWVGSGKSERSYYGVVKLEDYNKWYNGESGTIFVYSATKENWGNRINISTITTINNYGSEPDWLSTEFWW